MTCQLLGYRDDDEDCLKEQLWADIHGIGFNDVDLWLDDICLADVAAKIED